MDELKFKTAVKFRYSLSSGHCYSNMEISEKTIKFIQDHAKEDINSLRLKYSGNPDKMDIPIDFALLQIEARRKAQKKIPTYLENVLFFFPDSISAEQASNEAVARLHASLVESGSTLLDLTAGLGIDDMEFAKAGIYVTACEINEAKAEALRHNSIIMGLTDRINVINTDSIEYLRQCGERFDVVFSDPARRSTTGKRLHALSDCQPDILGAMDTIMKTANRLIVKASPMLDISLIRETVEHLSHIYITCLKGECKEVLIDIRRGTEFTGTTVIDLDMTGTGSTFDCLYSPTKPPINYAERNSPEDYRYLYEPNAGVMKTGAWGELCSRFDGLEKADRNTHLFLSDRLFIDFPGRVTAVDSMLDKKGLKELKGGKCNTVARNYPLSAPELAKKHSLIPGGDRFLYAFRYKGKPICVLTVPVRNEKQSTE